MKLVIFALILLVIAPFAAQASEMGTSLPSGTEYNPKRVYGFQITADIENVASAKIDWMGTVFSASGSYPNYYFNRTGLATGSYSYVWNITNATGSYTFPGTYEVAKNTTLQVLLTLNGAAADKSYKNNSVATIVASLPVAGAQIKLESSYPPFITHTNTTPITYKPTFIGSGVFTITASWEGNANYTGSSITRSVDIGPPRITDVYADPQSPVGYVPSTIYKVYATVTDTSLGSVTLESNFSGSMKTYTASTTPSVQNSSGTYWVEIGSLGARNFSFRWRAKDGLGEEAISAFSNYRVLRMTPLVMEILPSVGLKSGSEVTASCYSINPKELDASKFAFYKDYEEIGNISSSTRMDVILMNSGDHDFTCYTNGTANYSNQSVTKTVFVSEGPSKPLVMEGQLEIAKSSFPVIVAGQKGKANITIFNGLRKNIYNLSVSISGIPSSWYSIGSLSQLFVNNSETFGIDFSVPLDAETKMYTIAITVSGTATDGSQVDAADVDRMSVVSVVGNSPPLFSSSSVDTKGAGSNTTFTLGWYDDKSISGFIFSSNMTGEWVNSSWSRATGSSGEFDFTTVLESQAGSSVAWRVYANDSNNAWSESEIYVMSEIKEQQPSLDIMPFAIAAAVMAAFGLVAFIVLKKRKYTTEDDETKYVYSEEDANEQH